MVLRLPEDGLQFLFSKNPPLLWSNPVGARRRRALISLCAASRMWAPVSGNSSTGGWFGILGGTHEKDCVTVLFMSRLKIVSGLPYKIVIESWNTHASSSSQEALLSVWKATARGSRKTRERSQSVPLTLPASRSDSLFVCGPFPHCLSLPFQPMYSQYSQ